MESTTQASMITSSEERGKMHRHDKGEMRARVISNSKTHRLGAEPWILFGARNFTMICVSLCVTQAWQLCQTLCQFALWFWLPHLHFYYWEAAAGREEGHEGCGALWPCWCCYWASCAWHGSWSAECCLAHGGCWQCDMAVTLSGDSDGDGGGRWSMFVFVFSYKLDLVCQSFNELIWSEWFVMQFWWGSDSERI